jgi:hypothetical protein
MTEMLLVQTPAKVTIFHSTFIWTKSVEQKEVMECSNLPGIVACAVILLMEGWTLGRLCYKKSNFTTKDEHETCQLIRTKL